MPIPGILTTARSLGFYLKLQEVTANNLANANTDAFKPERLTARLLPGRETAVPVQTTDLQNGTLRDTGRTLDMALEGPGFFVVGTGRGERLMRGGSLRLDADGRLTDGHGDPVLGVGGPLVLHGSEVEVHGDGTVVVDGAVAGHLRLETVADPQRLMKEGYGRYRADQPTRPVDPATVKVRQGAIEEANLDPVLSMVDLVAIQRAYSTSIDAMRALDGVLGTITGEVGRVQ